MIDPKDHISIVSSMRKEIDTLNRDIDNLVDRLTKAAATIGSSRSDNERLTKFLFDTTRELSSKRDEMRKMREAYEAYIASLQEALHDALPRFDLRPFVKCQPIRFIDYATEVFHHSVLVEPITPSSTYYSVPRHSIDRLTPMHIEFIAQRSAGELASLLQGQAYRLMKKALEETAKRLPAPTR